MNPAVDPESSVAVIGLAGRFPGANSPAELARLVQRGEAAFESVDDAALKKAKVGQRTTENPHYVRSVAEATSIEDFDARYFGYAPKEAALIDPQQRKFLECCVEALEDGGVLPGQGANIGVYAGCGASSYLLHQLGGLFVQGEYELNGISLNAALLGNKPDFLSTRPSYLLGLTGPSLNVQSACSTSLAAIVLAWQGIVSGECDAALAGGVSIRLPLGVGYLHEPGGILSPDGVCRPFDASGGGIVPASGWGAVLLKRLDLALRDGNPIRAIVRGANLNNDGNAKLGFTAPSVQGQVEAISTSIALAGVDPARVELVEAHGTGTALGDPLEVEALADVLGRSGAPCTLASVKGNVGHLDAAAGVASFIATVNAVEQRRLPPLAGYRKPNPKLNLPATRFVVLDDVRPWHSSHRIACVNATGIGGTNAHVVLESYDTATSSTKSVVALGTRSGESSGITGPQAFGSNVLLSSAPSKRALEQAIDNLEACRFSADDVGLAEMCWTLQHGRTAFSHRRSVPCWGSTFSASQSDDALAVTGEALTAPRTVFLFPGGGSQHLEMGEHLWKTDPTFRDCIEEADAEFRSLLGVGLVDLIYPARSHGARQAAEEQLAQLPLALGALYCVEVATSRALEAWGIQPDRVIGHSLGDYAAACVCGVFSLADGLRIVVGRAERMARAERGAMLATELSEADARALIASRPGSRLDIAVLNGALDTVVSGPAVEVQQLAEELARTEIQHRLIRVATSGHSALLEPVLDDFQAFLREFRLESPRIEFVSNLDGRLAEPAELTQPEYWTRHLRHPVRFKDGIEVALAMGPSVLIEVGPGTSLSRLVRQHRAFGKSHRLQSTLALDPSVPTTFKPALLGALWVHGLNPDFEILYEGTCPRMISLPTYPFQRQRLWIAAGHDGHPFYEIEDALSESVERNPSTPTERRIVDIWKEHLGVSQVPVSATYTDLGGTSFLAIRLARAIGEALDFRSLLPRHLLAYPSVEALGAFIDAQTAQGARQTRPPGAVRLGRQKQGRPLLFMPHAAGGEVFLYSELAEHLSSVVNVVALSAPHVDAADYPPSVEALAEWHLQEIVELSPTGPYRLLGSSLGGMIAYELGLRLQRAGKQVAYLGLVDAPGPDHLPAPITDDASLYAMVFHQHLGLQVQPADFSARARTEWDQWVASQSGGQLTVNDVRRIVSVFQHNVAATFAYQPEPTPLRLSYFKAATRRPGDPVHPEHAWEHLTSSGFQLATLPGDHISIHFGRRGEQLACTVRQSLKSSLVEKGIVHDAV